MGYNVLILIKPFSSKRKTLLFKAQFFPDLGHAIACGYGCGDGGEGSCGGVGGFCCSVPQYGLGQGEWRDTQEHTGTYARMLHLPFSALPLENHRVLQGAAQRGAQFYFIFAVLRTFFHAAK